MRNVNGYHLLNRKPAKPNPLNLANVDPTKYRGFGSMQVTSPRPLRGSRKSAYFVDDCSFMEFTGFQQEVLKETYDDIYERLDMSLRNQPKANGAPILNWPLHLITLHNLVSVTTSLTGIGTLRRLALDQLTVLHSEHLEAYERSHSWMRTQESLDYSMRLWHRIRVIGSWDKQQFVL